MKALLAVPLALGSLLLSVACSGSGSEEGAREGTSSGRSAATSEAGGGGQEGATPAPPDFAGRALVAISDVDMQPSAYAGVPLDRPGRGVADTLTSVPLPLATERGARDASARELPIGEAEVSNSMSGWPYALGISPDGDTAYVIETNAPAGSARTLEEIPPGDQLTSVDLSDPANPSVVEQLEVGEAPETVSVHPDGSLLAVTTGEAGRQVQLVPVRDGSLGEPQDFPLEGVEGEAPIPVGRIAWHPSGDYLAVVLQEADQIVFYEVSRENGRYGIEPLGDPVEVGKYPSGGYFTPDGRHFVTNELKWGEDVEGFYVGAQPGELTSVRFDEGGAHEVVSRTRVGISPEGMDISPDGSLIVTANLRRSYVAWDDSQLTDSSVSLATLDTETGRLRTIGEYGFEGILPEGVAFDAEGDDVAIAVADYFDFTERRGGLEFWRVNREGGEPSLERTGFSADVVRGAHQVELIP